MPDTHMLFVALVFTSVFLMTMGLSIPVFGESRRARRKLQQRLERLGGVRKKSEIASLLRKKYLKSLSPTERRLESLPGMETLGGLLEEADYKLRAYQAVIAVQLIAAGAMAGTWLVTRSGWFTLIAGLLAVLLPLLKLVHDRRQRIARFEEQLPEAIDVMKRALQAGHPFSDALHLVSEELEGPVAKEFRLTFADLNYGNDLRRAMLGLLQRVPSVTVMVLVTSVLIHRETGGNLAEILDQISKVVRNRFRFQRRVKTLSAEGRMSAWILTLLPFALFVVINLTTPGYLDQLIQDPLGSKLVAGAFLAILLGVFWIRRILRIQV